MITGFGSRANAISEAVEEFVLTEDKKDKSRMKTKPHIGKNMIIRENIIRFCFFRISLQDRVCLKHYYISISLLLQIVISNPSMKEVST